MNYNKNQIASSSDFKLKEAFALAGIAFDVMTLPYQFGRSISKNKTLGTLIGISSQFAMTSLMQFGLQNSSQILLGALAIYSVGAVFLASNKKNYFFPVTKNIVRRFNK